MNLFFLQLSKMKSRIRLVRQKKPKLQNSYAQMESECVFIPEHPHLNIEKNEDFTHIDALKNEEMPHDVATSKLQEAKSHAPLSAAKKASNKKDIFLPSIQKRPQVFTSKNAADSVSDIMKANGNMKEKHIAHTRLKSLHTLHPNANIKRQYTSTVRLPKVKDAEEESLELLRPINVKDKNSGNEESIELQQYFQNMDAKIQTLQQIKNKWNKRKISFRKLENI